MRPSNTTHPLMHARSLGILPTDVIDAAAADARTLEAGGYTSAYEEYSVGSWASAPLWSDASGQASGEVREHDDPAQPIPAVAELDGINSLVRTYFATDRLRCARLFRASHGAIVMPHTDYLEHGQGFTRLHVPLIANADEARNTEGAICFHMRRGEVWFLDARRVHSGGVAGPSLRVHLVLDFTPDTSPDEALSISIPPADPPLVIDRPPLPPGLLSRYRDLASYIDATGWRDIMHLLARVHLRYDSGASDVYDWLETIASLSDSGDRSLLMEDALRMKRYYISDGPSSTTTFHSLWSATSEGVPSP